MKNDYFIYSHGEYGESVEFLCHKFCHDISCRKNFCFYSHGEFVESGEDFMPQILHDIFLVEGLFCFYSHGEYGESGEIKIPQIPQIPHELKLFLQEPPQAVYMSIIISA